MIPNSKMLFSNIFDDYRISPTHLSAFTDDVIARLAQNNTGNIFDSVLIPLQNAITPLRSELGQVDTSINLQVGKTATANNFMKEFVDYMRENYINIAAKLGGDTTPAFKEFYPHGKTEYIHITKTKLPTINERLHTAAATHSAELGSTLTAQLQGFQAEWEALREIQLEGKAAVKTNRAERSTARKTVEIALLKTIHFIGDKYPGDEQQCKVYFDFNLLFGVRHG